MTTITELSRKLNVSSNAISSIINYDEFMTGNYVNREIKPYQINDEGEQKIIAIINAQNMEKLEKNPTFVSLRDEYERKLSALQALYQKTCDALKKTEEEHVARDTELNKLTLENRAYSDRISALSEQVASLSAEVSRLSTEDTEDDLDGLREADEEEEISSLKDRISELESTVDTLTGQLNDVLSERDDLESKLDATWTELRDAEEAANATSIEYDGLQADYNERGEEILALESKLEGLQEALAQRNDEVERLSDEKTDLTHELEEKSGKIEELEKVSSVISDEYDSVQADYDALRIEYDKQGEEIHNLESRVDYVARENFSLREELRKYVKVLFFYIKRRK